MIASLPRMLKAAEREVAMRRSGYVHMVHKGRMTQADADEEIAAMVGIVELLRMLAGEGVT